LTGGGDLSTARILAAHERGIFPWYFRGSPGAVVDARSAHGALPGRIPPDAQPRQTIRNAGFTTRVDVAFPAKIDACAA
jgi:Leu/Phe-tRNA-protein transferase